MPTWSVILITAGVSAAVTYLALLIYHQLTVGEKVIHHRIEHLYGVEDEQFLRTMAGLLPPPIVPGNRITPLVNGDQIFPAMLSAIRSAQKTITFETFIYWSGRIGREVAEALAERARAGVEVHILLDWFGSKAMDQESLMLMERAGCDVLRYHKPSWREIRRLNHRTHRKLLVVDGRIGFTGGVGIADQWTGNAQDPDHWRDTHFQLEGPVVQQLQTAFMDNWLTTHDRVLHDCTYFPPLEKAGDCLCQVFRSSPRDGSESVRLMYYLSLTAAERSVRLATAYFVPDELAISTFKAVRQRGVRVQIIVPGPHIDWQIVRRASRARWGELLEAGVEIYEYMPTMFHCKLLVVDEAWVSIGSANFDNRSFRLNDEVNLNVLDRDLAAHQIRCFEQDLSRSRRICYDEWKNRPLREKVREHLSSWIGPQL